MQAELIIDGIEFLSLDHSQLDITNESAIRRVFRDTRPNVVLNAAAWTRVDDAEGAEMEAWRVNARGAGLLAKASSSINSKLMHISTDYVFSGISNTPWPEGKVPNPVSAYGRTKAEGELLVHELSQHGALIVRTAWLYSPWGQNFAKTMARLALYETRKVEVVNDQIGQPTSALDLARQILEMIDGDVLPGIYHGTNGGQATWFDFTREIFSLSGADPERVMPIDSSKYVRAAERPAYSVMGHNRWAEVGMQPMRDWREALKEAMPAIISSLSVEE